MLGFPILYLKGLRIMLELWFLLQLESLECWGLEAHGLFYSCPLGFGVQGFRVSGRQSTADNSNFCGDAVFVNSVVPLTSASPADS